MNKNVFLILASGVVGMAVGSQFPSLPARASEVIEKPYHFSGNANAALQTKIENADGVGGLALNHLNGHLGTSHSWSDGGSWTQCPVSAISLRCKARNGDRSWQWDYTTPNLKWTLTPGEPE